ncbi:MAG TPA: hypothetical protein VHM31_21220 [Polyangia bacterium]|nr:hypothetical protein [Polyangia bacterium]
MRRWVLIASLGLASAAGCKPDLGAPPSLVAGPRILAVRGLPAESVPGGTVTYDILAVDVTGTAPAPDVAWAQCLLPDPPAFGNDVSDACLTIPDDAGPAPTFTGAIAPNVCAIFGPQTPPVMKGQPPTRPADPDPTGGFYPPVRAVWQATGLVAFALERVTCRLANAPPDVATDYATKYTANQNPLLSGLLVASGDDVTPLYAAGQSTPPPAAAIRAGQRVLLQADFSDDSAETFLVWDVVQLKLLEQRESLRVAWYATGGAFRRDVTGRASDDPATYTQNEWTAPATPGPVHLWAVLRDNRGGIDFASAEIDVTP